VWLPNTSIPGYNAFTRYFYSQQNKDGAVIDERYNHGGSSRDYIVNELDRKPMGYFAMRDGKEWPSPGRRHLRPEGDDHQRVGRLGGDAPPLLLPPPQDRPLVGTRHGAPSSAPRPCPDDRRRRHHGAEFSVL
jgi:tricorn protease